MSWILVGVILFSIDLILCIAYIVSGFLFSQYNYYKKKEYNKINTKEVPYVS